MVMRFSSQFAFWQSLVSSPKSNNMVIRIPWKRCRGRVFFYKLWGGPKSTSLGYSSGYCSTLTFSLANTEPLVASIIGGTTRPGLESMCSWSSLTVCAYYGLIMSMLAHDDMSMWVCAHDGLCMRVCAHDGLSIRSCVCAVMKVCLVCKSNPCEGLRKILLAIERTSEQSPTDIFGYQ